MLVNWFDEYFAEYIIHIYSGDTNYISFVFVVNKFNIFIYSYSVTYIAQKHIFNGDVTSDAVLKQCLSIFMIF